LVTEQCGKCHVAERDGYMASPHGQFAWLGGKDAPKCVDCHAGHDIVRVSDPASPVGSERRLETCRRCHEQANEQFAKYHPHGTISDFAKYPGLWLLGKGMGALIVLVLVFLYTHSLLWWWRERRERPVVYRRTGGCSYPVRIKRQKPHSGVHFRRFAWGWRVNHWLLVLSLMLLVFTGMVVMYPNTNWAQTLVSLFGGPGPLTRIHHWAGVVFLLVISGHVGVILVRLLRDRDFDWFGPDSLLPRRQDWEDVKGQFRWYFGMGEQPRFGRWTYWEKFDYWAVYWGAFIIGLSGLLLWFSDAVGTVLPGWVFNLAMIAHGLEAFLAVMTLFVVHFSNNHFRDVHRLLGPGGVQTGTPRRVRAAAGLRRAGQPVGRAPVQDLEPDLPPVGLYPVGAGAPAVDTGRGRIPNPGVVLVLLKFNHNRLFLIYQMAVTPKRSAPRTYANYLIDCRVRCVDLL